MKHLLLILTLLAAPLAAQTIKKSEDAPKEPQVQRLFVLKYADPYQIANLIRVFSANVTPDSAMHALAVSASKESMAAIEDAIKRLDVPASAPQDVELTFYFVVGGPADGQDQSVGGAAPPKELESVITQLRNTFTYKSYRLMDAQTIRARTGTQSGRSVDTSGIPGTVTVAGVQYPISTSLKVSSLSVSPDGVIRINGLSTGSRIPTASGTNSVNINQVGLSADVDVKEGQRVVVGKSGINGNEALFLVLSAHVVQ